MPGRTQPRRRAAATLAAVATIWSAAAAAQPSGATAVFGSVQVQQAGASMLVTTRNGAGTNRSVIDWRSFSVPGGSTTHFQQPGADSLSINRVTGGRPSDIYGTLSSNGRLVLVNPAGIAVGKGAVVDTAGFTASTLALGDDDAVAGRLRFSAGRGKGDVDVRGRILARSGDVVLLGTDVKVDKEALVQAPNGSILLAAGQRVSITGRGLEGILLEVTGKEDRVTNLGRLEGDAVGLFATHLRHTGAIQARHVVLEGDKVRLERGGKDRDKDGKGGNGKPGKGHQPGNAGGEEGSAPPPGMEGSIETPPETSAGSGTTPPAGGGPDDRQSRQLPAQALPPVLAALATGIPASTLNGAEVAATLDAPAGADPSGRPGKRVQPDPQLQCVR
ncbi:filamentous hemagglutinin N-terminal domain-containing protein [Ramlibacter sp. USB13]|uniref:Filamentous hemagglutinin N-terminal domain-containing protein n=1 Tax=Ramlibacter cellulosilyticus TaxID=2764187 RepID=A0A923MV94_9BURK|nr:filamentous hemagglutinin N-terminal domain-containing protein [Ramlibacter cellulosilyticus]MBC5785671.1 filamentous hemagglutinin N-terminal domain-containing protein [Ramlibacter cellulosilyticus]